MDKSEHKVIISGKDAEATAALLGKRLGELDGAAAQVLCDASSSLAQNETANTLVYSLGAHDTPAFAVEKIVDELAERGWIALETDELSPAEEAQIRERLQGLGYVD